MQGKLNNLIRTGIVSSMNGAQATVRVTFGDKDDLVSADLPVLQQGNGSYWMPVKGDQVVCLFLANGLEQGFCLGSFYSNPQPPPSSDPTQQVIGKSVTVTGNITVSGNVSASGAIIDSGGNTNHHSH